MKIELQQGYGYTQMWTWWLTDDNQNKKVAMGLESFPTMDAALERVAGLFPEEWDIVILPPMELKPLEPLPPMD